MEFINSFILLIDIFIFSKTCQTKYSVNMMQIDLGNPFAIFTGSKNQVSPKLTCTLKQTKKETPELICKAKTTANSKLNNNSPYKVNQSKVCKIKSKHFRESLGTKQRPNTEPFSIAVNRGENSKVNIIELSKSNSRTDESVTSDEYRDIKMFESNIVSDNYTTDSNTDDDDNENNDNEMEKSNNTAATADEFLTKVQNRKVKPLKRLKRTAKPIKRQENVLKKSNIENGIFQKLPKQLLFTALSCGALILSEPIIGNALALITSFALKLL